MKTIKGMSLITTMVAVSIIAIVAALAVSIWRNHATRDHVDDALKATDAAKLVVMEAATTSGGLASIKARDLIFNASAVTNTHVGNLEISDGGRITLITKNTGATPDPVLVLTPSESTSSGGQSPISWSCTVAVGDQSIAPPSCRGSGAPEAAMAHSS